MKTSQQGKDRLAANLFIAIPVIAVLTVMYLVQKKVILSP